MYYLPLLYVDTKTGSTRVERMSETTRYKTFFSHNVYSPEGQRSRYLDIII